jgi:hypothetical protein
MWIDGYVQHLTLHERDTEANAKANTNHEGTRGSRAAEDHTGSKTTSHTVASVDEGCKGDKKRFDCEKTQRIGNDFKMRKYS